MNSGPVQAMGFAVLLILLIWIALDDGGDIA